MTSIDAILAELGTIRDRLQGSVDAIERVTLHERQGEPRAAARAAAPPSRDELQAQLERLVEAWDRLQGQRIDVAKQAGDPAAGNFGFTSEAVRLRRMDSAHGWTELEDRIRGLKAKLVELES